MIGEHGGEPLSSPCHVAGEMRCLGAGIGCLALLACGGDDGGRGANLPSAGVASVTLGEADEGGLGDGGADDGGDGGQDDGDGGDDGADDGGDDDDAKFDLGATPDGGEIPLPEPGCHKIDFLFVVDNSQSMEDDQDNLVANFPSLIAGIESSLEEVDDYHVGVVATDGYAFNPPGCNVLGGLVTQTGGTASSNAVCGPYAEGNNYMTEVDDLTQSFSCAAKIGVGGWPLEAPMNALEATVRGDNAGPGQCNEGFIRPDALLVAVIITDEWDGPGDPELITSSGTPQSWYDTVIAAKQFPENAAVVSLVNYEGGPCPPAEPGFDGQQIVAFTELFGGNGFVGGVCADYGPVFEQAVGLIDDACKNFQPPVG